MITLAIAGYGSSQDAQHILWPKLVFQPIGGGAILAFSNFNQIHDQEPEISVGIFSPT